jgi:hypothetical protein
VDAAWQRGSEGRGSGARRMDWDDEGGGGCGGGSGMGAVLRAMVLAMVRAKARRRRLNVGWRAMVDDGRRWSRADRGQRRTDQRRRPFGGSRATDPRWLEGCTTGREAVAVWMREIA